MRSWLLRGLIFAFAMVVLRLIQGKMINTWESQAQLISIVLVLIFAIAAVIWGYFDGRSDAAAQPDPDRRRDLAMTWLLAGLVAGILSGAVAWLISLFYKDIYAASILNEVTTFAAFTALLVFLGGITGASVGRYLIDRAGAYTPHHGHVGEERVDTDVFAAVRSDEAAAAEGGTRTHQEPKAVATAEREEYGSPEAYSKEADETAEATEEVPTTEREVERDKD